MLRRRRLMRRSSRASVRATTAFRERAPARLLSRGCSRGAGAYSERRGPAALAVPPARAPLGAFAGFGRSARLNLKQSTGAPTELAREAAGSHSTSCATPSVAHGWAVASRCGRSSTGWATRTRRRRRSTRTISRRMPRQTWSTARSRSSPCSESHTGNDRSRAEHRRRVAHPAKR